MTNNQLPIQQFSNLAISNLASHYIQKSPKALYFLFTYTSFNLSPATTEKSSVIGNHKKCWRIDCVIWIVDRRWVVRWRILLQSRSLITCARAAHLSCFTSGLRGVTLRSRWIKFSLISLPISLALTFSGFVARCFLNP